MPKERERKKGPPKVFIHTVEGAKVGLAADFEGVNRGACAKMEQHVRDILNNPKWSREERVQVALEAFVHPDHRAVAKEFLTRAAERLGKTGSGSVFDIVFDEKKNAPVWVWKSKGPKHIMVAADAFQAQFLGSEPVELRPDVAGALFDIEGDKPSNASTKGFRKHIGKRMFDVLSDESKDGDDRIHSFMKEFIAEESRNNPIIQEKLKEAIARMDKIPGYMPFNIDYVNDKKAIVWRPTRPLPEITRYLEFDDGSRVALPTEISLPLSEAHENQKKALADDKNVRYSEAANHMAESVEAGMRQWLAGGRMPLEKRVDMCRDKFVHENFRNSKSLSVFKEAAERLDKNPDEKVFNIRFEPRTGNLRWKAK